MPTQSSPLRVLFLCTHNSARSILAEALLNHLGKGRFRAYSAGSRPRTHQKPNPIGLAVLREAGIAVGGLRSKSWDEFVLPDAPPMDLVITVCDSAAGEVCPYWPGQPVQAHWGYADPSTVPGGESAQREAFQRTLQQIRQRLQRLVDLPAEALRPSALAQTVQQLAEDAP